MFNATDDTTDDDIREACKDCVFLQCWPHLARKVGQHAFKTETGKEFFFQFINAAHMACSEQHFELLCDVGLEVAK